MFELPKLPYTYDALEPHIDAKTMEIHHTKHHQGYIDKLNKALENYPDLKNKMIEELIVSLDKVPESIRTTVRNNAGGHYNHSMFWKMMAPSGGAPGKILEQINKDFGSFENFKKDFSEKALSVFGSGWVWLALSEPKGLSIITTPNQDSPIMTNSDLKIILGLDVWEHAYYLKHQNRRVEYIEVWWNVVNWPEIEKNFTEAN